MIRILQSAFAELQIRPLSVLMSALCICCAADQLSVLMPALCICRDADPLSVYLPSCRSAVCVDASTDCVFAELQIISLC